MITSGKDVTVVEITGHFVVTNIPLKVLLKDTISDCITEAVDECIQTAFGGSSLPTAIKDLEIIITNLCNFVAVKANNRDTIFFVVVNRSISRLPVFVVSNCVIHLLFDLTHEKKIREDL